MKGVMVLASWLRTICACHDPRRLYGSVRPTSAALETRRKPLSTPACRDTGRASVERLVGPCTAAFDDLGGYAGIRDRIKHADMPYQQSAWEALQAGIEARRAGPEG